MRSSSCFILPGLAMAASEFALAPDGEVVENPEIGEGLLLEFEYQLEDVAELHVKRSSFSHICKRNQLKIAMKLLTQQMLMMFMRSCQKLTLAFGER